MSSFECVVSLVLVRREKKLRFVIPVPNGRRGKRRFVRVCGVMRNASGFADAVCVVNV